MPKLTIKNFDGEYPRTGITFLPENGASRALNVRLYAGELQTWNGPSEVEDYTLAENAETIYRFVNPSTDAVAWLSWDSDVDVQRSSLTDTEDFRLYYTGDGAPKKTNWALATDDTAGGVYPGFYYPMGVVAPTGAPTLGATAGASTVAETRYYVYTNVSTFGTLTEESAPSPATGVTITASQSVDVSGFTSIPAGYENITHRRIYRTLPGEQSDGAFVFVKEITVATSTTNDNLLAAALGEALEATDYEEPPATMAGLVSMANGMMAGFVGNSVYFCEPYLHHAWPSSYVQSVPDQIVGLASYGNSLIVMTTGQPWAMTGTSPENLSIEKIPMPEPCIAKKSIAVDENGVMYASPNGIVGIGPTFRGVVSNKLFRRKEWTDYAPNTMKGAMYDGKYFLSFNSSVAEIGNKTMVVSRDDVPALSFLDIRAESFVYDLQEGSLFYLEPDDNMIYQLDADTLNPYIYEWTSKRFLFERAITWSVLKLDIDAIELAANDLYADQLAAIETANQVITGDTFGELNGHALNVYAVNGSELTELPLPGAALTAAVFLIDEFDVVKASFSISSYDPVRIPPFRSRDLRVKLTGNLTVRGIILATSFEELRGG